MAYAALERKPEADESSRKQSNSIRREFSSDPKDADAFFNLERPIVFYTRMKKPHAIIARRRASSLMTRKRSINSGMAETRLAHYPEAMAALRSS